MSIRDGDRLPRRRILTGSDLMIVGDRILIRMEQDDKFKFLKLRNRKLWR